MSVLPEPDVEAYEGGNPTACHDQFVQFLQTNSPVDGDDLPRTFAFEIACKVGQQHCTHGAEPLPLDDMSHAARKKAAAEHPGLCGVYHAHVIAAVKTSKCRGEMGRAQPHGEQIQEPGERAFTSGGRFWCLCSSGAPWAKVPGC